MNECIFLVKTIFFLLIIFVLVSWLNGNNPGPEWNEETQLRIAPSLPAFSVWDGILSNPILMRADTPRANPCARVSGCPLSLWSEQPEDNLSSSEECFNQPRWAQDTEIQIYHSRNTFLKLFGVFPVFPTSDGDNNYGLLGDLILIQVLHLPKWPSFSRNPACSQPRNIFSMVSKK